MLKKLIVILILLITFKSTYSNNDLPYGNDILLILNYPCDSTENHYSSVDFLRNLYKPWFPNIIFYGPIESIDVNTFDYPHNGYFFHKSVADAMRRYPNFNGYLYAADDCVLNCWNFTRFDKTKLWFFKDKVGTEGPLHILAQKV